MNEQDAINMLWASAAFGGLIIIILAAYIPAGKVPESKRPKSLPDATDEETDKARRMLRGRCGL